MKHERSASVDSTMGATTIPEISIIVISYNTRDMTLACLRSIEEQTATPHEVVVVDNASTDGSAEAIAETFPQIRLLAETINHGFAPAHDVAMEHARAPWILLLNPDTVVLEGAIDKLLAFAKRTPEAGIWGGRTLYGDGRLNPTSVFSQQTLWSVFCRVAGLNGLFRSSPIFNSEFYGEWPRDTEREVDIVTGCFFLIRHETWKALEGFDPSFVMYGEEADLCLRAKEAGFRPRMTPEAEIVHYGGASETVRVDKLVRMMKAKMELIKRHFPARTRGLGLALLRLWPLSRAAAFNLAGRLTRRSDLIERGRIWGETWDRRSEWQDGFERVERKAPA